ncbi:MAG: cobalamin biosynthesis protein CbiD [Deltaproteobacteria bacterium]|nr:cobalamin biosynthesis protein CbiD [Deltaproteobacteria bacterium]
MKKELRKGYTTGACAAAAVKAAALAFLTQKKVKDVEITLPIGNVVILPIYRCELGKNRASASVIKDAGDDPDVTNGAEIVAEVRSQKSEVRNNKAFQFTHHAPDTNIRGQASRITVFGGKGIGIVTKPGLAIPVGEPAINPVPRKMIKNDVREVFSRITHHASRITVVISVPHGEEIAKKTMNPRLGIIGGISILGTTGIVEPLSLSAYRHSITCAIDVAIASGCKELVFSTGRSSEKTLEKELELPEEAFILVGDHMGYALKESRVESRESRIKKIIIAGQFGKFSKLAAGYFKTHCTDSSIEFDFLSNLVKKAGAKYDIIENIKNANTARQVFYILKENNLENILKTVCEKVKENAADIAATDNINCILVGYEGEVMIKT